jgi:hypothetical protein
MIPSWYFRRSFFKLMSHLARRWFLANCGLLMLAANACGVEVDDRGDSGRVVAIQDSITCAACKIGIDTVAVLQPSDSVQFTGSSKVVHLPRLGWYVVAPINLRGQAAVFDSTGRFVRLLLRPGGGPGEMGEIRFVVRTAGDTIAVVGQDGRVASVAMPSGEVQDNRLPRRLSVEKGIGSPSGGLLLNILSSGTGSLAMLDKQLKVRRLFGPKLRDAQFHHDEQVDLNPKRLLASFALADSGNVWTVTNLYEIRLINWSEAGARKRTYVRRATWFKTYDEREEAGQSGLLPTQVAKLPVVNDIMVDSVGRVWILATVADQHWRQADDVVPGKTGFSIQAGTPRIPFREWDRFLDGVIEVIDPSNASVVARLRWPTGFSQVIEPMLGANLTPVQSGDLEIHILRFSMKP